jgi:hypothetical protein
LSEIPTEPGSRHAGGGVSFLLLHVAEIKPGNGGAGEKISILNFGRRIELNQFVPKNCSIRLAKIFDKFRCETIDNLSIFDMKCFVALFGFMPQRFDYGDIKLFIA